MHKPHNALQMHLDASQNRRPRNHVYGQVLIQSIKCPWCKLRAFVIQGRMSCCKHPIGQMAAGGFVVEVDAMGFNRRRPNKSEQRRILGEQDNRCLYCGDEFGAWRTLNGKPSSVRICWDHWVPYSFDGNNKEFVA